MVEREAQAPDIVNMAAIISDIQLLIIDIAAVSDIKVAVIGSNIFIPIYYLVFDMIEL